MIIEKVVQSLQVGSIFPSPAGVTLPEEKVGLLVVLDLLEDDQLLTLELVPYEGTEEAALPANTILLKTSDYQLSGTQTETPFLRTDLLVYTQRAHLLSAATISSLSLGVINVASLARLSRQRVQAETRRFYNTFHAPKTFTPGTSYLPYAARVFDQAEVEAAVDSSLDFWLTLGEHGERFQRQLARFLGVRATVLVNSGSSANLVAFSALTSPKLKDRRVRPGDEVITVAAGFPTTVNPIIQAGCVPVFLDSDLKTANGRVDQLEAALSRTKAVMMAHALGNPFEIDTVLEFCRKNNLWLIEDNCDALGSRYKGKLTGSFGDLSTQSFYPPHHLTMGEGGSVNVVRAALLKTLVESFRDWGRDCWCDSGKENTCGTRFEWQLGNLPEGYDHKYIYSHIGYNLKPLDIQAAIGCAQLEKLPSFVQARRRNWQRLYDGISPYAEFLELPEATPETEPSWFGFLLLVRPDAPFKRRDLVGYIESKKIQTRMLFGGNLARQPAYLSADAQGNHPLFRAVDDLPGADRIMNDAFFLGVYPGLTDAHVDYMVDTVASFFKTL